MRDDIILFPLNINDMGYDLFLSLDFFQIKS